MANLLLPSDISWLTIKHHSLEDVLAMLNLSDPTPLAWNTGVCTILADYWDARQKPDSALTRVYVSVPVDGWIFVFGEGIFVQDIDNPLIPQKERIPTLQNLVQKLSKLYEFVGYFTTYPRQDWFEWVWAENGTLQRHVEWKDGALHMEGLPILENEANLIEQASAGDSLVWEELVFEVLGKVCINPEVVSSRVEKGVLATTRYGKKVGVPPLPILDL